MSIIQKNTLSIILAILLSGPLLGQDSTIKINTSWGNVERELLRRADVLYVLVTETKKTIEFDSLEFANIRNSNIYIAQLLSKIYSPDSISLSQLKTAFDNSLVYTRIAIGIIDNNSPTKNNSLIQPLLNQLEACENRLALVLLNYNEVVNSYDRKDLILRLFPISK